MFKWIVHAFFAVFTIVPLIAAINERTTAFLGAIILMVFLWVVFTVITYFVTKDPRPPRILNQTPAPEVPSAPPPPTGKMRVTLGTQTITREQHVASKLQSRGTVTEYQVNLKIEISEEQRAILTKYNLWNVQVLTADFYFPPDAAKAYPLAAQELQGPAHFQMKHLLSPDGFHQTFPTPVDAHNFELRLKNETLPLIKKYIEQTETVGNPKSETFEL